LRLPVPLATIVDDVLTPTGNDGIWRLLPSYLPISDILSYGNKHIFERRRWVQKLEKLQQAERLFQQTSLEYKYQELQ
jgi:hypothetical protein